MITLVFFLMAAQALLFLLNQGLAALQRQIAAKIYRNHHLGLIIRKKKLAIPNTLCYTIFLYEGRRWNHNMPNIKSAKKRVLVNQAKAARNKSNRTALKTALKKAKTAEGEDKQALVQAAIQKVDQAAAKGLIHKNNAARKKSALAKSLNA